MNNKIVSEVIAAAQKVAPPEVVMKMSMEDSAQTGYERMEYEFANKSKNGWKLGVNRELVLRIYDRLCHCRDMEIELVWKRAIFMTAFLIACFAGYGGLIVAALSRAYSDRAFFFMTVAACFLATIGFAVSVLWIMMCKGSKAWYEHYEDAIKAHALENFEGKYGDLFAHDWRGLTRDKQSKKMSKCLLSTKGGAYSVSRLAIVVGQLAAIIWTVIFVGHGLLFFYVWKGNGDWDYLVAVVALALVLIVGVIVIVCSQHIATSEYLSKHPQNEEPKKSEERKE